MANKDRANGCEKALNINATSSTQAAHLTGHLWSLDELFTMKTPPLPWIKQ
jgi:hypothetical protein